MVRVQEGGVSKVNYITSQCSAVSPWYYHPKRRQQSFKWCKLLTCSARVYHSGEFERCFTIGLVKVCHMNEVIKYIDCVYCVIFTILWKQKRAKLVFDTVEKAMKILIGLKKNNLYPFSYPFHSQHLYVAATRMSGGDVWDNTSLFCGNK